MNGPTDGAKVADWALRNNRFSATTKGRLDLAERITKLGALVSDARVLYVLSPSPSSPIEVSTDAEGWPYRYRLFGLLPIIQWAQSLNDPATAPKDSQLKWIQKAQCWAMLTYYPLEHFCEFFRLRGGGGSAEGGSES